MNSTRTKPNVSVDMVVVLARVLFKEAAMREEAERAMRSQVQSQLRPITFLELSGRLNLTTFLAPGTGLGLPGAADHNLARFRRPRFGASRPEQLKALVRVKRTLCRAMQADP